MWAGRFFVWCVWLVVIAGCKSGGDAPSPPPAEVTPTPPADGSAGLTGGLRVQTFATVREAIAHILASEPRVVGVGEFHQTAGSAPVRSAIQRFTDAFEAMTSGAAGDRDGQKAGPISDLIVETWVEEGSCGKTEQAVSKDVKTVTERPAVVENHVLSLLKRAKARGVTPHVMTMKCEDYESVLQPSGEVDFENMLELIKRKLAETTALVWAHRDKIGDRRAIVLYGGSVHNDLYPYDGLDSLSYAADVTALAGDRYVEVDLYVPEYIAGNAVLSKEPWYPVFERRAAADRVIVIERKPRSHVVILRKGLRQ